jgi:hypothetical protein
MKGSQRDRDSSLTRKLNEGSRYEYVNKEIEITIILRQKGSSL